MKNRKLGFFGRMFGTKKSDNERYDAFISYRRETGSDLASLLKIQLENTHHKRIFLDVKELQVGRFDEMLLSRIEETPNFILILSKDSLDRCTIKTDWLKREIMQAINTGRNIIPVLTDNFSFPSEELWKNLPSEMRVLQSLNGIQYNHLYQDPAIEKINAFMKDEMSHVLIQKRDSISQPTINGDVIVPIKILPTSEVPRSNDIPQTNPGVSSSMGEPKPSLKVKTASTMDPNQVENTGNTHHRVPENEIIVPVHEGPKHTLPIVLTSEPYTVITGVLVTKTDGEEVNLPEFGIGWDNMGRAVRDFFKIERGGGSMNIPWNRIDSVMIKKWDDILLLLCDGKTIDKVKPGFGRLVGNDDSGFAFNLAFDNMQSIIVLRNSAITEVEALIKDIPDLVKRISPNSSYSSIIDIAHDNQGVLVTHDLFFQKKPATNGHSTFRLPGLHTFAASDNSVSINIASYGCFNLSVYDRGTAYALAHAFNRLNTLMYEKYGFSTLQE